LADPAEIIFSAGNGFPGRACTRPGNFVRLREGRFGVGDRVGLGGRLGGGLVGGLLLRVGLLLLGELLGGGLDGVGVGLVDELAVGVAGEDVLADDEHRAHHAGRLRRTALELDVGVRLEELRVLLRFRGDRGTDPREALRDDREAGLRGAAALELPAERPDVGVGDGFAGDERAEFHVCFPFVGLLGFVFVWCHSFKRHNYYNKCKVF